MTNNDSVNATYIYHAAVTHRHAGETLVDTLGFPRNPQAIGFALVI